MANSSRQCGFTLIELIITLSIAAIVTTIVVPGFTSMVKNTRLSSTAHQFLQAIQFTRSNAIAKNAQVAMCKSSDGKTCTHDQGWEQGWIVFIDNNGDELRDISGVHDEESEPLLRVFNTLPDNLTISGNKWVKNTISYQPTGFPPPNHFGGTLFICDNRGYGEHAKAVIINKNGRPFVTQSTNKAVNSKYRKQQKCLF